MIALPFRNQRDFLFVQFLEHLLCYWRKRFITGSDSLLASTPEFVNQDHREAQRDVVLTALVFSEHSGAFQKFTKLLTCPPLRLNDQEIQNSINAVDLDIQCSTFIELLLNHFKSRAPPRFTD